MSAASREYFEDWSRELSRDPEYLEWSIILDRKTDMPKLDDIYTSAGATLKASDLQGKARRVVIESFEVKEFEDEGRKTKKAVLRFEGKDKGLVVNKTNGQIIAHNIGSDELNDWLGHEIIMYPTRVSFGDQMVDAIRVKEAVPEVADLNDEIPF
jgi:hypothetical protein